LVGTPAGRPELPGSPLLGFFFASALGRAWSRPTADLSECAEVAMPGARSDDEGAAAAVPAEESPAIIVAADAAAMRGTLILLRLSFM
jgi:hypothetical protein